MEVEKLNEITLEICGKLDEYKRNIKTSKCKNK